MKKSHLQILSHYTKPKEQSINPVHMMAAVAIDHLFHSK